MTFQLGNIAVDDQLSSNIKIKEGITAKDVLADTRGEFIDFCVGKEEEETKFITRVYTVLEREGGPRKLNDKSSYSQAVQVVHIVFKFISL